MTGKVNIAGALHSIDTTGIVAYTGDLHDATFNKRQSEINMDVYVKLLNIGNGNITPTPPGPIKPDGDNDSSIIHTFMQRNEYDNLPQKNPNTLYFIYEDENTGGGEINPPAVQGSVKLEEQTLITDFVIVDTVLLTTGELDNNILTL